MTHRSESPGDPQIDDSDDFRKAANFGESIGASGGSAKRLRAIICLVPPEISAARTMRIYSLPISIPTVDVFLSEIRDREGTLKNRVRRGIGSALTAGNEVPSPLLRITFRSFSVDVISLIRTTSELLYVN